VVLSCRSMMGQDAQFPNAMGLRRLLTD